MTFKLGFYPNHFVKSKVTMLQNMLDAFRDHSRSTYYWQKSTVYSGFWIYFRTSRATELKFVHRLTAVIFYTSKETIQELQRVMFKMNFTLFLIDRVFLVKTCIFKILYLKMNYHRSVHNYQIFWHHVEIFFLLGIHEVFMDFSGIIHIYIIPSNFNMQQWRGNGLY